MDHGTDTCGSGFDLRSSYVCQQVLYRKGRRKFCKKYEMDRFLEKNNAFANLWIRLGTLSGLYWGVGDLITGLQVVTIIVLGAVEAVHGNISVGEFVAFASYNTALVWPIRENIAASRPEATMEEIREAAQIACVDDAIMSFPDGYETLVGERGVTLSGGQRQRVAIARMLLQKAPIMVFDDSLSAVDSETDHKIRQALKECMKDTTVILISHRITTLMGASQILVLNQGKIEEMGTHQELIERNGIYRQIYHLQSEYSSGRGRCTGSAVSELCY